MHALSTRAAVFSSASRPGKDPANAAAMATVEPAAKRCRFAIARGKAEKLLTPLANVGGAQGALAVHGRITFLSIGGAAKFSSWSRRVELLDDSVTDPVSILILGKENACMWDRFHVGDAVRVDGVQAYRQQQGDTGLRLQENQVSLVETLTGEIAEKIPALPEMRTTTLDGLLDGAADMASVIVKILEVTGNGDVQVRDTAGNHGVVRFAAEAARLPVERGEAYCFHRVSLRGAGTPTLWPWGGAELLSEGEWDMCVEHGD